MIDKEKSISLECSGIATFSVLQCLLEKLVERNLLNPDDVRSVLNQSIELNQRVLPHVHGSQNSDAVYLLQQLSGSLEQLWQESSK